MDPRTGATFNQLLRAQSNWEFRVKDTDLYAGTIDDPPSESHGIELAQDASIADERLREGRFQRSLSLLAGVSSLITGLEVGYEHYRGSYSRRVMYTPVILSGALFGAGLLAFASKRAARRVLRPVAAITLIDAAIGFYFHVRGVARKPGGWRLPLTNTVMGPPIFAPLLFGIAAYLGLIASFLRREDSAGKPSDSPDWLPKAAHERAWHHALHGAGEPEQISWRQDLREGRFQKHMAGATAVAAFLSGFEAWYSHYKNNFSYKVQWSPVIIAPILIGASIAAIESRKMAHTLLPAASALAAADGGIGFYYHTRGVLRRPGGRKNLLYNIIYGPPIFAPLLFGACGMLGLLASLLRRER